MPGFRVIPSISPATYVELPTRIWSDPASSVRASRITLANDRQNRFYRVAPGTLVRLGAILTGESTVLDDTNEEFSSWPIEYASAYPPVKSYPTVSFSSIVEYKLDEVGHYLLGMRCLNAALGAVFVHVDVTGS